MSSSYYDRHLRDPQARKFYNSAKWKRARANKLSRTPWCERCSSPADTVHHIKTVQDCFGTGDFQALVAQANLMSVCGACHQKIEAESVTAVSAVRGIYVPDPDDDRFFYDPDAAELPIRFIEKYVRHFEGRWAGELMHLLDWQKQLLRTFYGWKRHEDGKRRFTEMFLLSAKGAGKTPLMAGLGLFEGFAGGESSPHVCSMATNFKQASLTFDWAKKAIAQDERLESRSEVLQYEIRFRQTRGKWDTISGTFSGRAGFRPNVILADEAWEWPNSKLFDSTTANTFKREQPIVFVATNAAETRNCFCYQLYEQAKAVLEGKSPRTDLLPAIFESPADLDWKSEEFARAANPSIPDVVTFESIKPKIVAAAGNPAKEAEYKRLHGSLWVASGVNRWLDIAEWDALTASPAAPITPENLKDAALYVGLDLSEGDDLCSAAQVFVRPDRIYVRWRHWIPRSTAEKYESAGKGQYFAWERKGHIHVLEELTISPMVRRAIAEDVLTMKPVKVCYDPYRSDECVARLTAAGVACEPIRQGFGVSPGCAELERRMKEKTITFEENEVSRAAAENVEVKSDTRGNIWPVKPNAKGSYKGTRAIKIDPITSLVTALVEARKHEWPRHQQQWTGVVVSL